MPTNKATTKTDLPRLLGEQERDCCESKEQTPTDNQQKPCVEGWDAKQNQAENELTTTGATKDKAEMAYDNASEWEGKLKAWVDDADKADRSLKKVCSELSRLAPIATRLEQNTGQSVKALEALLCLAKKIFDDVREVLKVSKSPDDPKDPRGKLEKLKLFLECHPKLNDEQRQKALESIAPYEKKMEEVSALGENVLIKILETLTAAALLEAAMTAEKKSGLKWQFENLHGRLCGDGSSTREDRACGCRCPGEEPEKPPTSPCDQDVSLPTPPLLPIIDPKQPEKGSEYYRHLSKLYGQAKIETVGCREKMDEAKKAYDAALARKNSLEAAINAAKVAKGNK